MARKQAKPNQTLQQAAAAMLVSRGILSLGAAAAAELWRSAAESYTALEALGERSPPGWSNCGWGGHRSVLHNTTNKNLVRIKTLTKGKGF
jgi:hypothetical protein